MDRRTVVRAASLSAVVAAPVILGVTASPASAASSARTYVVTPTAVTINRSGSVPVVTVAVTNAAGPVAGASITASGSGGITAGTWTGATTGSDGMVSIPAGSFIATNTSAAGVITVIDGNAPGGATTAGTVAVTIRNVGIPHRVATRHDLTSSVGNIFNYSARSQWTWVDGDGDPIGAEPVTVTSVSGPDGPAGHFYVVPTVSSGGFVFGEYGLQGSTSTPRIVIEGTIAGHPVTLFDYTQVRP